MILIKKFAYAVLFFITLTVLLPATVFCLVNFNSFFAKKGNQKQKKEKTVSVYFTDTNKTKTVSLEKYLIGVVGAEMPASFEKEALKAQAVAARSFAVYKEKSVNPDHPDAVICTDSTHCKAYKSKKALFSSWGKNADAYYKKISDAVKETAGQILTYNDDVALTVFHSQSAGGRTENSKDVWGGSLPYLVSVESHGEENAPSYASTKDISFEEFEEKLRTKEADCIIDKSNPIGKTKYSDGGNVKSIEIGNKNFSGTDIRSLFELKSTNFTLKYADDKFHFAVKGYGHGVGMSQYGANQMAKEGFDYIQILTHYYNGTKISQF